MPKGGPPKKKKSAPSYTSGRGSGRSTASQRARGYSASKNAWRSTTEYNEATGMVYRYGTNNNMDSPNRVVDVFNPGRKRRGR